MWNWSYQVLRVGGLDIRASGVAAVIAAGALSLIVYNVVEGGQTPEGPGGGRNVTGVPKAAALAALVDRETLSRPPAAAPGDAVHALGDRLRVTVFERLDGTGEDMELTRPTQPGFVERAELTGDYVVQRNGYIVLPFLGAVEVEGKSTGAVVRSLEDAFLGSMRRAAKVSVVLAEREPVYVILSGSKSGSFKYTPGMTVLHAVALSGAGADERSELYAHTEYVREQERLDKATRKLAKALARAQALKAERSGTEAAASGRLIELAGAAEAKTLMEEAARIRGLVLETKRPQRAAAQTALASARREHANYVHKLELTEQNAKSKQKRRDMLTDLRKRDAASAYLLLQTESEFSEVQVKKHEETILISQSEARIAQAEQALAKLESEMRLELESEIAAEDVAVAELEAAAAASRRISEELRAAAFRIASTGKIVSFEVFRREREGSRKIAAGETTELVPGDLVRMTVADGGKSERQTGAANSGGE